ncbi:MAG: hypothetical protein Q9195_007686 [Heterodermia aff. obscurata]
MAILHVQDEFSSLSISSSSREASAIDASNIQNEAQEPRCHILDLPLEIRRQIYDLILNIRYTSGLVSPKYAPLSCDGMLRVQPTQPVFPPETAILLTNRQIHDEASSVLCSSNQFIRLTLYNDDPQAVRDLVEHSGMNFVCTNPYRLSKMTSHVLDIEISETPHNKRKRAVVLLPALYLLWFVNFLREICDPLPIWGRNHRITLVLRKQSSGKLHNSIRTLLEPWRVLHGISAVTVDTKLVGATYARNLEKAMMIREINPWNWVKSLTEFQESGARFLKKGKFDDAASTSALVGIVMKSTFHDPALAPALRKTSPSFHRAVSRLRFLSDLDVGLALIRLGSKDVWKEALTAATHAVDLAEDSDFLYQVWMNENWGGGFQPMNDASWYSDKDRSKARFARGSLMMVVGEYGYACADLSDAKNLCPKDTAIAQALEEAKGKYDTKVWHGAALQRAGISGHF